MAITTDVHRSLSLSRRVATLLALGVDAGPVTVGVPAADEEEVVDPSLTGVKAPLVPLARVYWPVL